MNVFGSIGGKTDATGLDEAVAKLRAGDSRGAFEGLCAVNPTFRGIAEQERGKDPGQLVADSGIDIAAILGKRR